MRMNLSLANNRAKAQKEKLEELEAKLKELADRKPEAAPVMELPVGTDIDVNALVGMFASKSALADLEKRLSECEIKNNS